MKIYCTACVSKVDARLTNGVDIYPHRPDLKDIPIWICDTCKNYVGCHHDSSKPTQPKGDIATAEVRKYRVQLHRLIDPLWKSKQIKRKHLYARMSKALGYTYHTANICDRDSFEQAYKAAKNIRDSL